MPTRAPADGRAACPSTTARAAPSRGSPTPTLGPCALTSPPLPCRPRRVPATDDHGVHAAGLRTRAEALFDDAPAHGGLAPLAALSPELPR